MLQKNFLLVLSGFQVFMLLKPYVSAYSKVLTYFSSHSFPPNRFHQHRSRDPRFVGGRKGLWLRLAELETKYGNAESLDNVGGAQGRCGNSMEAYWGLKINIPGHFQHV